LPVSINPFCVILVLREVDIQLVFSSRRHLWLDVEVEVVLCIIYSFVYIYII
jgi:hypothetical protein